MKTDIKDLVLSKYFLIPFTFEEIEITSMLNLLILLAKEGCLPCYFRSQKTKGVLWYIQHITQQQVF